MLALSAALLLAALGAGTYWMLEREFNVHSYRRLDDTVRLIQTILDENDHLPETLLHQLPAELGALQFNRYQILIMDRRGQEIFRTEQFPKLTSAQLTRLPFYQEGALGDGEEIATPTGEVFIILQTLASRERGSQEKVRLLVAYDFTQTREVLTKYARFVLFLIGAGTVVAVLGARWIVGQAIRPLTQMTDRVQRLKADRLHERFGEAWPAELVPLAQQFDRLLDEVEQGMARLSNFSSDLAHELRTPLTSLMLQAEIGLSLPRSAAEYQEILGSNIEELERLTGLVERLLLLARTESAARHLQLESIAVRELAERLVDYHLGHLATDEVSIHIPESARLLADSRLLEMALGNLLSNAAKYGLPPFRLEWAEYAEEKVISVQDSGPGIPADLQGLLFDRLFRADASRHNDGSSHGLGLALVRSALRAHGGEVRLHSAPAIGSRFGLYFPTSPCGPDEERSSIPLAQPG